MMQGAEAREKNKSESAFALCHESANRAKYFCLVQYWPTSGKGENKRCYA